MPIEHQNARVHLVHLNGAPKAAHFLICGETPGFRPGTRVEVQMPDRRWLRGVVDERPVSEAGSPIMVTLDR